MTPRLLDRTLLRSVVLAFAQASLVVLIVPAAYWLSRSYEFFPRTLIPIWTRVRPEDVPPTILFLGASAFVIFLLSHLIFGSTLPSTARRAAIEVYAFAIAMSLGAVAMFFLSMAVFDPELLLGIGLLGLLIFSLGHAAASLRLRSFRWHAPLVATWQVVKEASRLLVQWRPFPFALLALLVTTSPVVVAYQFKANREFADQVTSIRMAMLPDAARSATYTTVNAYPGLKLLQPIMMRFDPNDPNRAYVLERAGAFYSFDARDPVASKTLILDLTTAVNEVHLETGALGFAFHPDYRFGVPRGANDLFVYFTDYTSEAQTNYLSSFDITLPTPEARLESRLDLVALGGRPNASHNGGDIHFGPDGFLYFSVGDRLNFQDHQAIDRNLYGGIFRIDPDMQGGDISAPPKRQPAGSQTAHYFVPRDNPLVDTPDALDEYYAWGLRNPFRYSFDSEGRIWAGEVGAATWEEINIIKKGGNYQWPFAEGDVATGTARPDAIFGTEEAPIYSYIHNAYDRAVIGGFVVEAGRLPGLNGRYIFGDNFSGNLFAIDATGEKVATADVIGRVNQYGQRGLTSFTLSPEGDILITTMGGREEPEGEILKIVLDDGTEEVDTPIVDPDREVVATAAIGFERFNDNCATCHGAEASVAMRDLGHAMPNFADPSYHLTRSDAELTEILTFGGGRLGVDVAMPPWGEIMTDQEIQSVILYLRSQGAQTN